MGWLDTDSFECIRPSKDGWRNKKVLVVEFWASSVSLLTSVSPVSSMADARFYGFQLVPRTW